MPRGGRWQAVAWLALAVVIVVGQILSYVANGPAEQWIFFTNQSNVFLACCAALTGVAMLRDRAPLPGVIMGASAVYITITGLVYNVVLAGAPPRKGAAPPPHPGLSQAVNHLNHIATPILGVLLWLVLVRHGRLRWINALGWLSYPAVYLVFVLLRGALASGPYQYPYGFVSPIAQHGYWGVARNAVTYALAFWLIGLVFVAVDRLLARRTLAAAAEPVPRT